MHVESNAHAQPLNTNHWQGVPCLRLLPVFKFASCP